MIPTIRLSKDKELVVVGDIHENEWHFNEMLERAEVGTRRILVSVGDIYDKGKGPKIAERIVRKIRSLHDDGWAFMVRGNHEQRNIRVLKANKKKLTDELQWCERLPLVLSFVFSNQNRITVLHGGVTPLHTWKDVTSNTEVMYVRTVDSKGKSVPYVWSGDSMKPEREGELWHDKYDGRFGYIISGHNSQSDGIPKFYKHSCNLDTKCYKTGVLAGQIVAKGSLQELILVRD